MPARKLLYGSLALLAGHCSLAAPVFQAQEIDSNVQIGYGVAVADVDGDGKQDILLADKRQFFWYRNPSWQRFVLAGNLIESDNVCLAAADINGDGKAEVAVGAGWNPGDTENSGALFYLVPPRDRTNRWQPVKLPHEPTVHRMRWVRSSAGKFELAVLPLHGRGNVNGEGRGVKFLGYAPPENPEQPWSTRIIDDQLHLTHNFDLVRWAGKPYDEILLASREGLFHLTPQTTGWTQTQIAGQDTPGFTGAGEVRGGRLPGGQNMVVSIEPMHGHQLVLYKPRKNGTGWERSLLDDNLREGHALACGDLLQTGHHQVVVGWRGKNASGETGIKLFIPPGNPEGQWSSHPIDGNAMACEDLCLADLNNDGALDIVASGRATRNLKIYLNKSVPGGRP